VDYDSDLHETRTDREQSQTPADFRVSFESEREKRFQLARRGMPPPQGKHLYFIKIAKGRSPVKIGRANDPQIRLATLQVACPYGLKLLGVLEGCGPDETEFHWVVRESRLRGEWFAWSKHVEDTVKLAIAGGDWRATVGEERHTTPEGDWFYGSPLYARCTSGQ
jgi:hypothetical protein